MENITQGHMAQETVGNGDNRMPFTSGQVFTRVHSEATLAARHAQGVRHVAAWLIPQVHMYLTSWV